MRDAAKIDKIWGILIAFSSGMLYLYRKGEGAMAQRINNYTLQMQQAKKRFLTYDQQALIRRCNLRYDEAYFYITFLSEPLRICRC